MDKLEKILLELKEDQLTIKEAHKEVFKIFSLLHGVYNEDESLISVHFSPKGALLNSVNIDESTVDYVNIHA